MGFKNINVAQFFLACLLLTPFLFGIKAKGYLKAEYDSLFSYDMRAYNGPQNWGNLNYPHWRLCGTGKSQTPIDIQSYSVTNSPSLGDLIKVYKPAPAKLKKLVHEVQVEWIGDAGGIEINGIEYKLIQCHWHTPSEHAFNNISLDAELHLVHVSEKGEIAVVGILYELGPLDPFLELFLPYIKNSHEENYVGVVNPFWIGLDNREYYRYNGSLTTPACHEGVTWTVFKTVRTASREQITTLRDAIKDGHFGNARPIQALNGRPVYYFKPTSSI